MKPVPFSYVAPASLDELMPILASRDDAADTAILAGGQSLMPLMALRHARPTTVVDINPLDEALGVIRADGPAVRLGALVRQRVAERDARIAQRVPLLAEALLLCARPAIRTRGTIGGSLAYADPAAEIPVVASAVDATMIASGPKGERSISAAEFFVGPYTTALATDEFLSAAVFPDLPPGSGTCFLEISQRHGDRAIVAVAAAVTVADGTISVARVALGGVGARPVRAAGAEAVLTAQAPDRAALQSAAAIAAQDIEPDSDLRATAAYRRQATRVLVRRALTTAVQRAGGTA
jgi:aerobic carbon-monoxide dehydrogenase medium subunit